MSISIPEIYSSLADWTGRRAVEHCDCDCRAEQVFLALAYHDLTFHRVDVAFFTPDIESVLFRLRLWKIPFKKEYSSKSLVVVRLVGYTKRLYVASSYSDSLPLRAYLVDATHSLFTEFPFALMDETCISGIYADREHWFYKYARSVESRSDNETQTNTTPSSALIRIPLSVALKQFPKLDISRIIPKSHPFYKRRILLEDVEPVFKPGSFISFAKKRLSIRTDKPLMLLTARQREVAQSQYGIPIVPLEVSPLQRRYLAFKKLQIQKGKKPWFVLLKYRRGGFTTVEQALSYERCSINPHSHVATLAHTKDSAARIFRIVHTFREKDNEYAGNRNDDSKSEIAFDNGSLFFVGTAGGQGFGRGDTLQRVHGSEVSKWMENRVNRIEDVEDLIAALLGAASQGEVVFESTPNGKEWLFKCYTEAKEGINGFTPIFIRWFDDPLNRIPEGLYNPSEIAETITEEEHELSCKHGLTLSQIAFRREAKRTYGRLFPQEMPEDDVSCFLASGICYFDTEKLTTLLESLPISDGIERRGGFEHVWEEPLINEEYCIGVDTSEGLPGCDMNGVGVLKKSTGEQVASIHGLFSVRELAEHTARLARKYNDAMVGVERQNHGHAVLEKLREFYDGPIFRCGPGRWGWSTDQETRPIMLQDLAEAVEEGYMKVRDRSFVEECLSFRKQNDGKFRADSGAFDDRVMKWAIAWQMRKERAGIMSVSAY